jgi:hypothetical protein
MHSLIKRRDVDERLYLESRVLFGRLELLCGRIAIDSLTSPTGWFDSADVGLQ